MRSIGFGGIVKLSAVGSLSQGSFLFSEGGGSGGGSLLGFRFEDA